MESLATRSLRRNGGYKTVFKRLAGIMIIVITTLITVFIYSFLLAMTDKESEVVRALGQNFVSLIITIGISYPAILAAIFPIKYKESNNEQKKILQDDLFSFVIAFVVSIFVNTLALMALYSNFPTKGLLIAIMIGDLIGITIVFLYQMGKLLK